MEHVECLASSLVCIFRFIWIVKLIENQFPIKTTNFLCFVSFDLDRECPVLPEPENTTVTLSGREFGGKATYACPPGYNVVGVSI